MGNSSNPDLIALTCTACGAKLRVNSDIDRFACSSCGTDFLIRRGGGVVSLQPVAEDISGILVQNKRIAAELAITRLKEEVAIEEAGFERMQEEFAAERAELARVRPDVAYLIDTAMIVGGVLLLFSGSTPNTIAGALLVVAGVCLFAYLLVFNHKFYAKQKAMIAIQNESIEEVEANLASKKAQLDTLRRSLA